MLIHFLLTSLGRRSFNNQDKDENTDINSISDIPGWHPDLSDFQSLLLFLYHTANKRQIPPPYKHLPPLGKHWLHTYCTHHCFRGHRYKVGKTRKEGGKVPISRAQETDHLYTKARAYKVKWEYYFKSHISPAGWTVIKILSRELLRFSSNAKSQSVKKITPLRQIYNPSLTPCHVSSVYFQSKCIFFPHCSQGWGSAQLMNIKLSFFPAINNGQITKCRFWSWHVYCWWWCINWWPTASFSLSWEGPAGRIGEEKNLILTRSKTVG